MKTCACGCGEVTRDGRTFRHGHNARRPIADRFWEKVDRSNPNGCWLFTGRCDRHGYGRLCIEGIPVLAPRVAWTLTHGPIPEGLLTLHSCDVPACVRPDHLRLGTPKDNTADAIARGRLIYPKGRQR